jgi:hypothetical protein
MNEIHGTESGMWYDVVAEDTCSTAWCVIGANDS